MNRIILSLILSALFLGQAQAGQTTKDGYIACRSQEDLDLLIQAVVANDLKSMSAFINSNQCFVMQGGLTITVVDYPGMFGSTTSFLTNGIKFWTVREAINY